MTDHYLQAARTDAVQDLAAALIGATDKVMRLHGKDPLAMSIVVLGYAKAIEIINERIHSEFIEALREQIVVPSTTGS